MFSLLVMRKLFFLFIFTPYILNAGLFNHLPYVPRSMADTVHFVVAQDGSGHFSKVQDAINAIPDYRRVRTVIFIKKGVYLEKLILPESKQMVSMIGEDQHETVLSYGDWAQKLTVFGEHTGTSGSAGFFIYANDFYAANITFQNTAGPVGQAVAVLVSSDRCFFDNCRFLGDQDTLYTYGQFSRQYYRNCYIEGTTDFIFGSSSAVFDNCTIYSKKNSFITAASTPQNNPFGYLFYRCTLTADSGVTQVYLGRPWRDYAKVVFRECWMNKHIHPAGWHNWSRPDREKTTFFAEYQNCGPGAERSQRVAWSHVLSPDQAHVWTIENVLAGVDNWKPHTFK